MTPEPAAPARLGRGPRAFLACMIVVAAWTSTSRHLHPQGDGFRPMPPGGADLRYPYNGARALLAGVNPYHHDLPWLFDPWDRDLAIDGVMWRQFYPPSHFVLDVPLVVASGFDANLGTRLFFLLNLAALAGLSWGVAAVARSLGALPGDSAPLVAGLLFLALATSPAGTLVLERGQSDLLLGLTTWAGAWLCFRGRAATGTFLLSIGVLCKGYSVISAGGVLLLALLDPRTRRWALLGVAAAAVVLLAPVLHLIPDGIVATRARINDIAMLQWFNHSFLRLVGSLSPGLAEPGRHALAVAGLLAAAGCFVGALRASGAGSDEPARAARLLWTTLFMTVGLVVTIGWSKVSVNYNLFNLFPGVLVLGLAQERLPEVTGLASGRATSVILAGSIGCLCLSHGPSPTFPVAALGLVGMIVLGSRGALAALAGRPPLPLDSPAHA